MAAGSCRSVKPRLTASLGLAVLACAQELPGTWWLTERTCLGVSGLRMATLAVEPRRLVFSGLRWASLFSAGLMAAGLPPW